MLTDEELAAIQAAYDARPSTTVYAASRSDEAETADTAAAEVRAWAYVGMLLQEVRHLRAAQAVSSPDIIWVQTARDRWEAEGGAGYRAYVQRTGAVYEAWIERDTESPLEADAEVASDHYYTRLGAQSWCADRLVGRKL